MAKFDSIYNYYENPVFAEIEQLLSSTEYADDPDFYDDVACVALNQLQPHYVRHSVDAGFYMTSEDHAKIHENVKIAVSTGLEKVKKYRAGPSRENTE